MNDVYISLVTALAANPAMLLLCVVLTSCSSQKQENVYPPSIQTAISDLKNIETASLAWSERRYSAATNDPDGDSSTGDSGLFDGLLCSVGITESCSSIQQSQSTDGRFWRSPEWVNREYGSGSVYSRDMALGVLAYIITTKDKVRAENWGHYIKNNDYRLCPDESNCKLLSPAIWSTFRHTFDAVDAARFGMMWALGAGHETLQPLAESSPIGYQLHLIGVQVYILKLAGIDKPGTAKTLANRQPENPFYQYLSGNYQRAYEQTMKYCPQTQPPSRHLWQWERALPSQRPELNSGGWDCVFISKLLHNSLANQQGWR